MYKTKVKLEVSIGENVDDLRYGDAFLDIHYNAKDTIHEIMRIWMSLKLKTSTLQKIMSEE